MTLTIRALGAPELDALLDHFERHSAENGRGDTGLFGPRPPGTPFQGRERFRARLVEAWSTPVDAPEWERTWGAFTADGAIVGHIDIRARSEPSTSHRAVTSMGIEAPFRRRGTGQRLLEQAISWAESRPELVWLDLFVFEHNHAARALYEKMGFVLIGHVPDMFRVAGLHVTDVAMTRKLGSKVTRASVTPGQGEQ